MDWFSLFTRVSTAIAETVAPAADAAGEAVPAEGGMLQMVLSMAPLLLIVVVFYFMLIRPQRKKDKKVKDMLAALKVGDRVTTIGGIHGTIMSIKDETITLGVGAEKTKLVFARWAIRNVDEVSIENDSETLV